MSGLRRCLAPGDRLPRIRLGCLVANCKLGVFDNVAGTAQGGLSEPQRGPLRKAAKPDRRCLVEGRIPLQAER
ncbi:MAG: hypothetical protein ACRD0K_17345 [Egibacteraceae bacterium]